MWIGTGTSITFATGFLAELLDVSPPNASREAIQVSHMGTTLNHIFKPAKLVDWGELNCDIGYDPSVAPPVNDAAESIAITFPDSGATVWTFDGFMTGYDPGDPLEDRATAACTIKITGGITIT